MKPTALSFALDVQAELKHARARYPNLHSLHEAYAVIAEELDEFWDHVRLRPVRRDKAAIRKELVQIAAMAQRACEDLIDADGETL